MRRIGAIHWRLPGVFLDRRCDRWRGRRTWFAAFDDEPLALGAIPELPRRDLDAIAARLEADASTEPVPTEVGVLASNGDGGASRHTAANRHRGALRHRVRGAQLQLEWLERRLDCRRLPASFVAAAGKQRERHG